MVMTFSFSNGLTFLGKFYLVDSGYPNRDGYLAPYKGTKYHVPEFRHDTRPSGKKELFNFCHPSLRNVIEGSFGVLKMKIILACMILHNFIRESAMADADFEMCDNDENHISIWSNNLFEEDGDEEQGI